MTRTLVTGGTGLIGYHLIRTLAAQGDSLRVLHRASSDLSLLREFNVETVVADLRTGEGLEDAVRDCQQAYHLAAHVSMSKRDAEAMHAINVGGTEKLVLAAAEAGIKRFVNVSSIAAMGIAKHGPATETEPYNHGPHRPYMETKYRAEAIAHASCGAMELMTVRPSLVVGPGAFRRGMIAHFIQLALRHGLPFAPSGGINVVDVEDVVSVLLSTMQAGANDERFLAVGHNVSIRELMDLVCRLVDKRGPLMTLPNWMTGSVGQAMDGWMALGLPGELPALAMRLAGTKLYYDDSWTRRRLDLDKPRPLEQTLLRRIDWERKHG